MLDDYPKELRTEWQKDDWGLRKKILVDNSSYAINKAEDIVNRWIRYFWVAFERKLHGFEFWRYGSVPKNKKKLTLL